MIQEVTGRFVIIMLNLVDNLQIYYLVVQKLHSFFLVFTLFQRNLWYLRKFSNI